MLPYTSYFFLGIKGVAMTPLALIVKKMGAEVSGWDVSHYFPTQDELKKAHIHWTEGNDMTLPEAQVFVYSAAHGGHHHPFLQTAKKQGRVLIHQAELIAYILGLHEKRLVVTGCHGKTSTTALLAHTLIKLKARPTYVVGSANFGKLTAGDYDRGKVCVIEGDEYALFPPEDITPKVTLYNPTGLIVTNTDFDHPDVYKNLSEVQNTFASVIKKTLDNHGICITNADDPASKRYSYIYPVIPVGIHKDARYRIAERQLTEKGLHFRLVTPSNEEQPFTLPLYGHHNIHNTAMVAVLLHNMGYDLDTIAEAMKGFTGAKRRMELMKTVGTTMYMDDYAHHPKEIHTVLTTLKESFPNKKLIVLFQSHTLSRTKALEEDFFKALSLADNVVFTDIFTSAREAQNDTYTAEMLVQKYHIGSITYVPLQGLIAWVQQQNLENSIVLTLGAGELNDLHREL